MSVAAVQYNSQSPLIIIPSCLHSIHQQHLNHHSIFRMRCLVVILTYACPIALSGGEQFLKQCSILTVYYMRSLHAMFNCPARPSRFQNHWFLIKIAAQAGGVFPMRKSSLEVDTRTIVGYYLKGILTFCYHLYLLFGVGISAPAQYHWVRREV